MWRRAVLIVLGLGLVQCSTAPNLVGPTSGSMTHLQVFELDARTGKSFHEFILNLHSPSARSTAITIASPGEMAKASQSFDPGAWRTVLSEFAQKDLGFNELITELSLRQNVTAQSLHHEVSKVIEQKNLASFGQSSKNLSDLISPVIALGSGQGYSVVLNRDNYFLSTFDEHHFGVSPGHKALSSSLDFYMNELTLMMRSPDSVKDFYRSLLKILVSCETSDQGALSVTAQTVLTDFLSADASLLRTPALESSSDDLTEITFLITLAPAFSSITAWKDWKQLALHRKSRRKLQERMAIFMQSKHPEITTSVEAALHVKKSSDLMKMFVQQMNRSPNNLRGPAVDLMAEYLDKLHKESKTLSQNELHSIQQLMNNKPAIPVKLRKPAQTYN